MNLRLIISTIILSFCPFLRGQDTLLLNDLKDFRPSSDNWKVVESVEINPWVRTQEDSGEKRRKYRKRNEVKKKEESGLPVKVVDGVGVLFNY